MCGFKILSLFNLLRFWVETPNAYAKQECNTTEGVSTTPSSVFTSYFVFCNTLHNLKCVVWLFSPCQYCQNYAK